MRVETIYICEYCGKKYETKDEACQCEATHLGVPLEQYLNFIYVINTSCLNYPTIILEDFKEVSKIIYEKNFKNSSDEPLQ